MSFKYCKKCGVKMDKDDCFCGTCGTRVDEELDYHRQYNESEEPLSVSGTETEEACPRKTYYMTWYWFLIYFSLWVAPILNLRTVVQYITGGIYLEQSHGMVTADLVYETYAGLKILDCGFGLAMFCWSVFCIVTRFKLARYKKEGPLYLYILYASSTLLGILYNIGVSIITGESSIGVEFYSGIVVMIIIILANYRYFTRRKVFFVK